MIRRGRIIWIANFKQDQVHLFLGEKKPPLVVGGGFFLGIEVLKLLTV